MNWGGWKDRSSRWAEFILDLIFPINCLGCGREGDWLCLTCSRSIELRRQFNCPICQKNSPWGRVCESCQGDSFLDGLWVPADYHQELLALLIQTYKYKFISDLGDPLSRIIKNFLDQLLVFKKTNDSNLLNQGLDRHQLMRLLGRSGIFIDFPSNLLVPVPLHPKRLKERGFNQSEILARELSRHFSLELGPAVLERCRYTTPQVELAASERKINILGAFVCSDPSVKNKNVILVDDVFTTGATMQECAKVLKKSGASEVWGLVIARG